MTLPLFAALLTTAGAAQAGLVVPTVPAGVDCRYDASVGTVCGLYHDVSGSASASYTGGQSFSYQPTWEYTSSRLVNGGATDGAGGSSASGSATSFITFGSLKSQLNTKASTSGGQTQAANAAASTNSNIAFQDRLTVNDAALAGTLGTLIGRIAVSGSVDASTGVNPYTYARATAAVSVLTSNGLATDFFSSADWGGIVDVLDANGNPVSGWSVSSASGFDYTRSFASQQLAVSEPGSWALVIAGLAAFGAGRRPARSGRFTAGRESTSTTTR